MQMLKMKGNGGSAVDDGTGSSDYSGSPKSTYSDRLNTFEEEDFNASKKDDEGKGGSKRFIFPDDDSSRTTDDLKKSARHVHLS